MRTLEFGPLPEKDWTTIGVAKQKDGQRRLLTALTALAPTPPWPPYDSYLALIQNLDKKYKQMMESEVRYEAYQIDDAELILVAYGYTARVSKEAVKICRKQGLKVGLIRPITVWPFPSQVIAEKAKEGSKFLVVEDSLGQMVDDVELAVRGQAEVHLLGMLARHAPSDAGMILPERVIEEIKKLI